MLTWAIEFTKAVLWDEAKARRYLTVGLLFVGGLFHSGGVVPGTEYVIHGIAPYANLGELFIGASVWLATQKVTLPELPKRDGPPPMPFVLLGLGLAAACAWALIACCPVPDTTRPLAAQRDLMPPCVVVPAGSGCTFSGCDAAGCCCREAQPRP